VVAYWSDRTHLYPRARLWELLGGLAICIGSLCSVLWVDVVSLHGARMTPEDAMAGTE